MKKLFIILFFLIISAIAYLIVYHYLNLGKKNIPSISIKEKSNEYVDYKVEEVARNLYVPWSIVFTSPNRMLVSERNGKIREITDGNLNSDPIYVFDEVIAFDEEGLMGMVLDPLYQNNRYIYFALAYGTRDSSKVKIVRATDTGNSLEDINVILDNIPAARFHAGTRIKFGPEGYLYITTGDATRKENAQETESLSGKILRMKPEGDEPEVYALGLRNSQGIDWDPVNKNLWAVDHGPSVIDGPAGGDEVNLIKQGVNYGWPIVSHENTKEGLESPKLLFTPAVAPASLLFYTGEVFPQFLHDMFFGGLRGTGIYRVKLTSDRQNVDSWEKLDGINVGRVRDVVQGPDGFIYFSTSNTDGRGNAEEGDDKILRLVPSEN